jgi:hypothetical protein
MLRIWRRRLGKFDGTMRPVVVMVKSLLEVGCRQVFQLSRVQARHAELGLVMQGVPSPNLWPPGGQLDDGQFQQNVSRVP